MECATCLKKFSNKETYVRHQRQKCKLRQCTDCKKLFKTAKSLRNHLKKRKDLPCDHCERRFCNNLHLQSHIRAIEKEETITDLNQMILPATGYEEKDGFLELVRQRIEIRDSEKKNKIYEVINKQIDSSYTYNDLYDLLLDIYCKRQKAFKVNLGFGFILHNPHDDEYKYYYVSTNNLLFDRAKTISRKKDLVKLMNHLKSLDLITNYYFKRPSSAWTMAGLTNVEVQIFNLDIIL